MRPEIQDNGIGFDENAIDRNQKYGLLGIHERLDMINGQLSTTSRVGAGTEIRLHYGGAD